MRTATENINDVLSRNCTFFIPPFQRPYAWGKNEIERYFTDITRIIESELDGNQKDKLEHFFGTIVLKEEKDGFNSRYVIVDGQQRLTTTLIFLISLRDQLTKLEEQEYITNIYLKNSISSYEDKIKLKQVTADWTIYRHIIEGKKDVPDGRIKIAYGIFAQLIADYHQKNSQILLEHYVKALSRMNLAVIFLDERPHKGEDPHVIFETLNSLGKPLTLSDLVRNYILLNLNSKMQQDIYEKIWHPQIENVLQEETSKFFRDYLQYKMSKSIKVVSDGNVKEIYQIFKDFVECNFSKNYQNFIDDITPYAKWYKWITTTPISDTISSNANHDTEIKELLRNIFDDIKSEAFKPFVLGILEHHQKQTNTNLYDEKLIYTLKAIRTYLIRRRLIGLAQGENKNIVTLCKKIPNLFDGTSDIYFLLSDMFYSLRLPNDIEIREYLEKANFYEEAKKYVKFLLGKMEEHNSKVAVNFRDPKITIEHIMPQTLTEKWKTELGVNHEIIHKDYLHNIGNLILTEFNGEMGNKSFQEKKEKLENSNLSYRQFFSPPTKFLV